MLNKKCSFRYSAEVDGKWNKLESTGTCRSEIFIKTTASGTFPFIFVEQDNTGALIEVFANTLTMTI